MRAIRTPWDGFGSGGWCLGGGRAEKGRRPELPPMRNPRGGWASWENKGATLNDNLALDGTSLQSQGPVQDGILTVFPSAACVSGSMAKISHTRLLARRYSEAFDIRLLCLTFSLLAASTAGLRYIHPSDTRGRPDDLPTSPGNQAIATSSCWAMQGRRR